MRAGSLDTPITIERATNAPNEYGTPTMTWTTLASARAQVIMSKTEEFIHSGGANDETAVVFRTRWIEGVTAADRVVHDGRPLNIKEVKPLGRRRGLEIRTVTIGGAS